MIQFLKTLLPGAARKQLDRVLASPLGGRLARGAFWSFFGSALARVLSTVSWVLVGRFLGKGGFGELNMIQNTVGMFGTIAAFGMGMATMKYVAQFRHDDPERAGRFIGLASATNWILSGFLALVLVIAAPWLARETLKAPQLTVPLQLSALMLLFNGVSGASTGALGGFEAFKAMARVNIWVGVGSFPLMVAGAFWGDVTGALWGLIASALLNTFVYWLAFRSEASRHGIRVIYRGCWKEARVFWEFNLPGMLNTCLSSVVLWGVGAIMVRQAQGFGDLGLYNAAQRIRLIPESVTAMVLAPMLPVLVDSFAKKDTKSYGKSVIASFLVSGVVIIPLALLQLAAPWLTSLPYGQQYQGGDLGVVTWLMLGTIAYSLSWPMGNILISTGRIWFAFGVGLLSGVVNLALAFWLIPLRGATGMAMAAFFAFMSAFVPCLLLLFHQFPAMMKEVRWMQMLIVTLVFVGLGIAAQHGLDKTLACIAGVGLAGGYIVWRLHPKTHRLLDGAD